MVESKMSMKSWITNNIQNFNSQISSEEDLKVKVILPYLKSLGYEDVDLRLENGIEVVIGSRKTTVFSDIEILINGAVELVIDVKKPTNSISEKDILQSSSYAKLISTPPALYSVTANGVDCVSTNVLTGRRTADIPSKAQLIRDLSKAKKKVYTEVEIREIRSVLLTILEPEELYKVINKCKTIIEKKGLIRSDQSFREMTKILLVKMNEERRVNHNEGENRFTATYLNVASQTNDISEKEVFENLFSEAKSKYPDIYATDDEKLLIQDQECLVQVVTELEPFSFLGTGDDIKGTVYEVFLKSTLRGDFDQYFTPREIVDFIVNFADPEVGDVFLDPACGSGGFLIQAFNFVNQKIVDSRLSELQQKEKFNNLIEKSIWGHEADYDLHVLAKINLIMHGDGWNNIYQGDTLSSVSLPENYFDLVMTNPPFTIKYNFPSVLSKFEMGLGKDKEELDILFVEKSLSLLKPNHDLYIVLPEGLLNLKTYKFFRTWLLGKAYIVCSISLPEGAFIPFGKSVSKTCILGLRKKDESGIAPPEHVFLGKAVEIGYETGKNTYKPNHKNDLGYFNLASKEIFDGIKYTDSLGECGWIKQDAITDYRFDASYLLNIIDREQLKQNFNNFVLLRDVCLIDNKAEILKSDTEYAYLEVPDISPETGLISNIRKMKGKDITAPSLYVFEKGDILFTRINPRKSRITIAPPIDITGVVSKEVYRIKLRKNNPYIKEEHKYVLVPLLQSQHVRNQIVRLSNGSSSSRARVQEDDLLDNVFIPLPDEETQKKLSAISYSNTMDYWNASQIILNGFVESQNILGSDLQKDLLRSV